MRLPGRMCRSASVALSSYRPCPVSRLKFWSNGATENSLIIWRKQHVRVNDTWCGWMPTKYVCDVRDDKSRILHKVHNYSMGKHNCDSNSAISPIPINIHRYEKIWILILLSIIAMGDLCYHLGAVFQPHTMFEHSMHQCLELSWLKQLWLVLWLYKPDLNCKDIWSSFISCTFFGSIELAENLYRLLDVFTNWIPNFFLKIYPRVSAFSNQRVVCVVPAVVDITTYYTVQHVEFKTEEDVVMRTWEWVDTKG